MLSCSAAIALRTTKLASEANSCQGGSGSSTFRRKPTCHTNDRSRDEVTAPIRLSVFPIIYRRSHRPPKRLHRSLRGAAIGTKGIDVGTHDGNHGSPFVSEIGFDGSDGFRGRFRHGSGVSPIRLKPICRANDGSRDVVTAPIQSFLSLVVYIPGYFPVNISIRSMES
jgi:hypothetical protein